MSGLRFNFCNEGRGNERRSVIEVILRRGKIFFGRFSMNADASVRPPAMSSAKPPAAIGDVVREPLNQVPEVDR